MARPSYRVGGEPKAAGTAFFLPVQDEVGVAAVAAAHSFELVDLVRTSEVEFRLGRSGRRVAIASRFLVTPGRPFREAGATMRDDFMVFALDAKPFGVRALEPDARAAPESGERVRIWGVPGEIPQDEDDLFGTVKQVSADRIEVELDAPADLRGWGGAPVLTHPDGCVLGILQAAWPSGSTLRLGVSPIGAVLDALRTPLAGGLGQPFAAFEERARAAAQLPLETRRAPRDATVPGAAKPGDPSRAAHAERPDAAASGRGGSSGAPASPSAPGTAGPRDSARTSPAENAPEQPPKPHGPLIERRPGEKPELRLSVEHPDEGAVIGDANGAFVAGRALALRGELRHFDVVLVIDTSASTAEPTGADVNENGVVGKPRLGGVGGLFGMSSTDPGDSILAAEVAAARRLLRGLDARSTRVALVSFAGEPDQGGGLFSRRAPNAAITEEPLTTEYPRIERALTRIVERGPEGSTHMAAGVDQATIELLGLRGGLSKPDPGSEKFVLFLTDGQPTLPYGPGFDSDNVRAVLRAADRARRVGIRIHSFAIGPEALDGPVATVEMAARTQGQFTPVRHPAELTDVIEEVSFANVESIALRNLTSGAAADHVQKNADGSFAGLVPLVAGKNRIEVRARASDGAELVQHVNVVYAPGAPDPVLPGELVAQRNALLERKLLELRRGRLDAERERTEQARKELLVEIEKERAKAQAQAERQRKELELDVERPEPKAP